MKLSRRFLVLAATLAAAPLAQADVTVNYASPQTNPAQVLSGAPVTGIVNLTNLSAPGSLPSPTQIQELNRTITSLNLSLPVVAGAPRTQLVLDQQVAATTQVKLLSADFTSTVTYPVTGVTIADVTPLFIKTGGGTLQYDAFKDINYFGNNTFTNNSSLPNDLRSQGAFSGIAIVQQGSLVVSGYLNQWAEYGAYGPVGFTSRMVGAKAVIVQGNSTLSFQNTPYNIVGVGPTLGDSQLGNPSTPLLYRLNFVHNLYAGTLVDFVSGAEGTDVNTILDVGKDADYAVDAHFDAGMVGSIGRIDGAGRLYKSGTGQLTILNSSRLTGDVFIAGGDLVLNDPNGLALRQAASVNLIGGSPTGQTTLSEFNQATDAALGVEWHPGYLPAGGAPVLEIRSNQTIRNLQALYSETAANLWDAGPGSGSRIDVSANQRLIVIQDENLDGYYTGSINGGQGVLEKQGVGSLALMGTSSSIGQIDITAGKIIANVQSLGYGRVVLGAAGTLSIVQNNAGTLRAQINGAAGSVLTVAPTDAIVNTRSGGVTIGNGQLGVIDVYNRQDLFYGDLVVKNGITLAFSFGQDNTFVNASSIVLSSGLGTAAVNGGLGYETTIRFNDTTQRVNNLVGDANTRIELGRGSVTLNQNAATTYQGKITGVGNLVKQGANTLTLSGLNSYYGATVVKQGTLALTGANSIQNTAGLVLLAGGTLDATGDQTVGSLFGQVGATINLHGGTLTVGKTTGQIVQLNAALDNFPGVSPDANPAYYLQTTPTVDADITLPYGVAGAKTLSLTSVNGLSAGSPVTGIDLKAPVTDGDFYIQTVGTGAALGNTLTMADVTGLSVGQAVGSIAIVKPINNSTAAGVLPATVTVGNADNLAVGQTVTGLGIPAGTRIQNINGNTITLSAALTAASSGLLTVATGIPAGTTIVNINGNTLTLSNALTAQAAGSLTASQPTVVVNDPAALARLAVGQTVYSTALSKALVPGNINVGFVTVADPTGLAIGQMVTGVGIPAGTTITNVVGNVVSLSATTTAATTGTLTVLTGIPTGAKIAAINGNLVTLSANLVAPGAGTLAIKSGIAPGSVITGINDNVLTLDTSLTDQAAGALTNLPVAGMSRENTVGFLASTLGEQVVKTVVAGTAGANTLTLADVGGLAVGRTILGTGIPAGAKITAINGNDVTLDHALTATAAGSVRVLTSTDLQVLSFRGDITGTGGLTKIGPERLILGGVSTYSGATSIQGGILQVNWNALPNTSGIVIGALGSLAINVDSGSHSFDRPITGTGGFEKLGAGTLVINTTSGWSTGRIDIIEGSVQFNPGNLASITGGIVNVRAGTNFQLNTPNNLAWTGSISGAGDTSKTGAGTLTIGGTFTSTGTLSVLAGKVIVSALPTDGTDLGVIAVSAGTTFVDKVADTTGSQLAAGTIIPVASSAGFYVGQEVFGDGIDPGSKVVAVGANSLTLDTPTTSVANGAIFGAESYGRDVDLAGTQIGAGASVTVADTADLRVGMRVFNDAVPGLAGLLGTIVSIDDATHFTLSAATTTALNGNLTFLQGDIKGAGDFEKAGGGVLELNVPLSLTGAVNLTGGAIIVNTAEAFASASSVNLGAGTTLDISGFDQDLANMSGAATSTLFAIASTLTVNVGTGLTTLYRGQVIGGTIEKLGAGTFNLARLGTDNSIAAINVHAGTLIGSEAGFGAATLSVDNGAVIGFNNDDPTQDWVYSGQVTSTGFGAGTAGGTILKTGAGLVELDNPFNTATNFVVQGGKLVVHDDRANGTGLTTNGYTDLPTALISDGASLAIQLGDQSVRVLGGQIAGVSPSSITTLELATTGSANVDLSGPQAVTALNLLGAVVVRSAGQANVVAFAGDSASQFIFTDNTRGIAAPGSPAQAVTLRQAVPTTMLGYVYSFIDTDLTLVGPGRASFVSPTFAGTFPGSGAYGFNNTLTVGTVAEAGHLEILAAFANKTITLAKNSTVLAEQGSVAVRAEGGSLVSPVVFDGTVDGVANAGRFIKTGSGYLDGRTASVTAAVFSSYEIEAGHFVVQAANGSILGNRPITLKGGFLDIEQDSNPATLSTGSFAASSGTGVIEVHGSANSGLLTIDGSFAGGLQLSDQSKVALGTSLSPNVAISGSITVDATSFLKGSAVLGTLAAPADLTNAGIIAPGYSPGVITVTGDVTNSNTYQLELSAAPSVPNGPINDRIEFYGVADLDQGGTGRIELSRFGAAALPYGQRYVLFKGLTPANVAATGGVAGKSFLATANVNGLKVGQGIAGTGLAAGTTVAAVIPQVALTATGGSGSDVLVASATGLVVGQVITGTGIAAGSVITAINGTTLTLDKATTATPAGTLTAAAGVTLSAALTAAPAGTVTITPSTLASAYYTSVMPATSISMVGLAPKPYLLSIPTAPVVGVPVSPNEIAVYSVRAADDYLAFRGPSPLITVIQDLTRVDIARIGNGVNTLQGDADDVWQATPAGTFNLLGSKLAVMTDAQLQNAIDNLTPYGAASVAAISIEGLRVTEDALAKRLEMRRFDRSGLSIVQSEWFFNTDARQLKLGAGGEVQTKGNLTGVSAGLLRQSDDGVNYGFVLGGNHVTTSGDTSARFSGNDIRADVFAGGTFFNDLMSFDVGASVSHLSGSATRASIVTPGQTNTSSPSATTIGGWARLGTVLPLKSVGVYATPFLGVEVSSTKVSGLGETGQADALQVSASSITQTAIRAGVGFHKQWESEDGTWRYRFSTDVGYLKQGSGETGDFSATNADAAALDGTSYTSPLRVTGGSGFYLAPSLSFGPDENTTYSLGLTYEKYQGTSTGLNFSYRKRF